MNEKYFIIITSLFVVIAIVLFIYLLVKSKKITKEKFNRLIYILIVDIIAGLIVCVIWNFVPKNIENKKTKIIDTGKTENPIIDTTKPQPIDSGKETIGTSEDMGGNLYKIGYYGTIFGYLKLPSEIDMITLYSMEGNIPKEGSTVIMEDSNGEELNMIDREQFLKKLGSYINTANINKRKLIISAHGEKTQWYAANLIKFGKDPKKLNYLKQVNMWHPVVNEVIQMQGWINYPQ